MNLRGGKIVFNGVPFNFQGNWSAGTYAANSAVRYGSGVTGGIYVTATSTSAEPGNSPWVLAMKDGAKGDKGDTGLTGPQGDPGVDAGGILTGSADPSSGDGVDNDFYMQTGTGSTGVPGSFWKKTSGSWAIIAQLKGPTGAAGSNGTNGTNGATLLHGAGAPADDPGGTGADGDYYVNETNGAMYGPKTAGAWGAAFYTPSGGADNANDQYTDTGTDYTVTGGGGTINFGGAKNMTVVIPSDGDYLISAEVCEDWSNVTAASGEATYYQLVKTVGSGSPLAVSGNLIGTAVSTLASAIVGPNVFSRSWSVIVPGLLAGEEVSLQVVKIGSNTGGIKIRSAFGDAQSYINAVKCN